MDDSSSEEATTGCSGMKPVVPPRPRNLILDHKGKFSSVLNTNKQRSTSYDNGELSNIHDELADRMSKNGRIKKCNKNF